MRRTWDPSVKPKRQHRFATPLLLPEDETALLAAVAAEYPDVRVIDGRAPWPAATTSKPPVCESVLDVSQTALLWLPSVHPRLAQPRFTGRTSRSPQAGKVVHWRRGSCTDGMLGCSVISVVVWHDMKPEMIAFFSTVWRALLRGTSNYLVRWIDGTGQEQRMPTYRVGHHALAAAREGRIGLGDERFRVYPPSRDKARGAVL